MFEPNANQQGENLFKLLILWCCRGGLNSRPLPYQGSALPLSYCSTVRGSLDPIATPRKPILDGAVPLRYANRMARKTSSRKQGTESREARLKAALKANLGRRKAQAKAREAGQETKKDSSDG